MSERDAIERVETPVTTATITSDLTTLGIDSGDTLLVHASLSALGWVVGGAQAVVDALMETLSADGTLVMPSFTSQYSDPRNWSQPPVPEDWIPIIEKSRPAFRPDVTPPRNLGAIPECFRTYPGVQRSQHPEVSFAVWGTDAANIVADHALDYGLGENSPLARLYDRNAKILMLGTDHDTNTSLHLAEYRADILTETESNVAPLCEDGERVMREYVDIALRTADFDDVGAAFEDEIGVIEGTVGAATAKVMSQQDLVDFAVEWFDQFRT